MKIATLVCLMALPAAVHAAHPLFTDDRHAEDVYQRLEALEQELSGLRALAGQDVVPANHEAVLPCPHCGRDAQACDCDAKPATDKFPTVKVIGLMHVDAGYYHQDAVNRATLGDIEDGLGFRRARLGATGKVAEDVAYHLEFDFAQAQARFIDVWMQFNETPWGNVRIGRFRQPFGMADLSGIKVVPFLERPLTSPLSPFRQTGIMLFDNSHDERITWAISGYRHLSDIYGNVYADTGGYGTAARLTYLPVDCGDDRLVHVGAGYSFSDPGRDLVQFASTNEFFVGQNPELARAGLSVLPIDAVPPFVQTGPIPTNHINAFNLEGAVSLGRLVVQSEARWALVDQTNGVTNTFPAAYAHVRYMLTSETIPYNRQAGVFGRIKPLNPVDFCCGQWGAWEIDARWSYIDLNGAALPGPGRRLNDFTAGLNWYFNERTRFQLNWIHSELSDPTFGDSSADTFAMRAQLDF